MGESSAAHGRHSADTLLAGLTQTGLAGIDGALVALAAVNGQGAAALLAIRGGKRDPAFKHRVTVFRRPAADRHRRRGSRRAVRRLTEQAAGRRGQGQRADRGDGKGPVASQGGCMPNTTVCAARRQLRASAMFAGQAATALKRVPALRAAAARTLTARGVVEVFASDAEVVAFISSVRSGGIPGSLRPALGRLGVTTSDLAHLRTGVLGQTVTSASGPVLIAPLTNAARATELRQLTTELSHYSARARRHPIAR